MLSRFEQFMFSISCINRHIQRMEREEMVRHGCRGSFTQYLLALYHYEQGVTAVKLAALCDKDKAAISRAVAEMEEKGLVERQRDGNNTYRARICLTEQGKQVAELAYRKAQLMVREICKDLTGEERQSICSALNRIATRMHDIDVDAALPESGEA